MHAFMCANSQCIPFIKACDGIVDCEDNSDEIPVCKGNIGLFLSLHEIHQPT